MTSASAGPGPALLLVVGALAALPSPAWAQGGPVCSQGPDADGDGLSDDVERFLGTDPASIDSDRDGLTDDAELTAEPPTSPRRADTDGDGRCDGELAVPGVCGTAVAEPEPDACHDPPGGGPRGEYSGVSGSHVLGCQLASPGLSPSLLGLALALLAARGRRPRRWRPTRSRAGIQKA